MNEKEYNKNPKKCFTCKKVMPYKKRYNKFCNHSCAAKTTNIGLIRARDGRRYRQTECLSCGMQTTNPKYCNSKCAGVYRSTVLLENWKNGTISGLDKTLGIVSQWVKNYLRKKYDNKCYLCGWSEINPHTGKVPLVADHIDGNWKNNRENNLRLICPNCDSLQATYGGANKGNGRGMRYKK